MTRTSRKRRFAMFAVSAAIATGGALVPTGAFAAQAAAPHTGEAATLAAGPAAYTESGHEGRVGKGERGGKDRTKGKKNNRPRDVENMPGCTYYQGKVYCEHKPDKPHPAPKPAPKPAPDPEAPHRENPDQVPAPAPDQVPAPDSGPTGTGFEL
ncbi:hypothetical protein [Streptomyces sp. NPDC054849]